jgi:hypothetical protein
VKKAWLLKGILISSLVFLAPIRLWAETVPTQEEVFRLGLKAYIFGYPLVLMEMTRQVHLQRTPVNHFAHALAFPTPSARNVVRPNCDTLYSSAWVDLSQGPVILSVPDTHGRYYLVQVMDAWTETLAVPGKRTTGTQAGHFALVGPGWKGDLPPGIPIIQASTHTLWLIGRIQTNTAADYENVRALQKGFTLTPLSRWKAQDTLQPQPPYTPPPPPPRMTPPARVAAMDARTFFQTLALLLKDNPPHKEDGPLSADLSRLGLVPGAPFPPTWMDEEKEKALERAVAVAKEMIREYLGRPLQTVNGWRINANVGRYGTDYLTRAATALGGLGALPPEDAYYLGGFQDEGGRPLNGARRYLLRFEKDALPPVRAFWSVTLYGKDGFFVPNPLNRYTLGDRDPLIFNPDGSLDLYIQKDSPGKEKEPNWLPAPQEDFNLSLRLYWPKEEALTGKWQPPRIRLVEGQP